jgi:hypothetical protein
MRSVILRKSLLALPLPAPKMQFSLYYLYTSFQVTTSMWLLTMYHSFHPSPVLQLDAISGITFLQLMIFRMLTTFNPKAAGGFLTCTTFETGSMLQELSLNGVSARASQYSTKAPSLFWSLNLNSRCSCHGRRLFRVP